MAAFEERIQALVDEFYDEQQKEGNKRKDKWDVLDKFSAAHQIALGRLRRYAEGLNATEYAEYVGQQFL